MSVQGQLVSSREIASARCLLDKNQKKKPPKIKRFNSKIFERPPEDASKAKAFTLKHVELPYEDKRKRVAKVQACSFRWALSNAILTTVAIVCAIADSELEWYGKTSGLESSALRVLIIAVSILQITITVKYAHCKLKRLKLQGLQHLKSILHSASLLLDKQHMRLLLGQILHLCIVMPPWVDFTFRIKHNQQDYNMAISNFVTIAIVLRVYHIISFIYSQSPYHSQQAQFFT